MPQRIVLMEGFGDNEYRKGARERWAESSILLDAAMHSGSIYLAGRAVEAMFRAVIWKHDPQLRQRRASLETGHDLRELLARVRNLGLMAAARDDDFELRVQRIARLWFNNMRFASTRFIETRWVKLAVVTRRQTMKQASRRFFEDCTLVVKRCEVLCQS